MVTEVNKLVYNSLTKYSSLYLPGIGSLSILRSPASVGSRNEILPPHYSVEFRKDNVGISIVDIIAREAGVETSRAEEIYNRWLEKSKEGTVIKIDRVGTINGERFECDNTLIAALNANNHSLTITPKRSGKPIAVTIVVLIVAALGYGSWWYNSSQTDITELVTIVDADVESNIDEKAIIPETEIIEEQASDISEISEIVEEIVEEEKVYDWRESDNIHHWLVVGSYSTTQNAERAISDIVKRMPDAQCDYFKLGSMFAVAVYGSKELSDCQEFKQNHIKEFPQSWIYTPKRYR